MNSKKLITLVLALLILVAALYFGKQFLDVDACLDSGSRWNYEIDVCEKELSKIKSENSFNNTNESAMTKDIPEPYPSSTPEQQANVERLSNEEVEQIDKELLGNATDQWRKVAMIIGRTMMTFENKVGIPDIYYADRIKKLVEDGRLVSRGNLDYMRFSEVRLTE